MKLRALLFSLFALAALLSPPAMADKYPSVYATLAAIPCSTEVGCAQIGHVQISAATTFGTAGLVSYDWYAVGDGLCSGSYYRPSGTAAGCFVPAQINANSIIGGTPLPFPATRGAGSGLNNIDFGASTGNGLPLSVATTAARNVVVADGGMGVATTANSNAGVGFEVYNRCTTCATNWAGGAHALFLLTTGASNTGNGDDACYSLIDGNGNTCDGEASLYSNQHISGLSAFGNSSLFNANGGTNLNAFGRYSLVNDTIGSVNSCFGDYCLQNINTGSNDLGFGTASGAVIADGTTPNQTSTHSIYLGHSTKALANGDDYENVFGFNVTGHGSYTTTIGDNNNTNNYLYGTLNLNSGIAMVDSSTGGATSIFAPTLGGVPGATALAVSRTAGSGAFPTLTVSVQGANAMVANAFGNASFGGTCSLTKPDRFCSDVQVDGNFTVLSTVQLAHFGAGLAAFDSGGNISSTLSPSGLISLGTGTLTASGAAEFDGTLKMGTYVSGACVVTGYITITAANDNTSTKIAACR